MQVAFKVRASEKAAITGLASVLGVSAPDTLLRTYSLPEVVAKWNSFVERGRRALEEDEFAAAGSAQLEKTGAAS